MVKIIPKIVFIDTNIYINCALEEADDSDLGILNEIEKKLNNNEMIVVLPEIIKTETLANIEKRFDETKCAIDNKFDILFAEPKNKEKTSKLIMKAMKESKDAILKSIEKNRELALKIINKIFKNVNIKFIKNSEKLILLGLKRAIMMEPPFSISSTKNEKQFKNIKDHDCFAFESLLYYLKSNKKSKVMDLVICCDDKHYYKDKALKELFPKIKGQLISQCKKVTAYTNPLEMLKKEFNKDYTNEDIKKYEEKKQFLVSSSNLINSPFVQEVYSGRDYNMYEPASFSITGQLKNKIKFCPYCGKDISKYIEPYSGTNLMAQITTMALVHYDNKICCPYCGKPIEY